MPKVFISYSHDSPGHSARVLGLANALRGHGVDAELDQYHVRPEHGWPHWCEEQLREENAEFVLLVCTETYRERVENKAPADEGRGVYWEGAIIYNYFYDAKGNRRFIPILLDGAQSDCMPWPIRNHTHYSIATFDLDDDGYQKLYRELTQQRAVVRPSLGERIALGPAPSILSPLPVREVKTPFPSPVVTVRGSLEKLPASGLNFLGREPELKAMLAMAPVPLGEKFVGRTKELGEFDQAWQSLWNGTNPAQRIVAVVAWGGFGKTALVRQWLYLKERGWPEGTAPEGIFWWTFGKTADADGFLNDAIAYFSGKAPEPGTLQSDYQKLDALRHAIGNRRFLLVLDGLEAVQRGARGEDFGKTTASLLASILKELALGKLGTGLSLITSRLPLTDLGDLKDGSVVDIQLEERPLELVDARLLLKVEGVTNATDAGRDAIIEWCGRHPLALKTLAGILQNHNGGKASGWERFVTEDKLVQPPAGREAERQLWRILHWYDANLTPEELGLISVLAHFREPVGGTWVEQLFVNNGELVQGRLREPGELRSALDRLVQFRLLERAPGAEVRYDLHALLAEHFRTLVSEVDRRAIHDKLDHYYSETVQPEFQPETLDGLRPLYEAVYHGCKAGLYQAALVEVYRDRILRGAGLDGFYSTKKLGAVGADLGAVACFFEEPWRRLAPGLSAPDQAWLLNEAATRLRSLGRLSESLEPMRVSGEMDVKREQWQGAAISYGNLSELELTLGELAAAEQDAERSAAFADKVPSDWQTFIITRTTLASARHQLSARANALALFNEAEAMQVQQQPYYPLLYSIRGFQYCDLLLGDAERMARATSFAPSLAATNKAEFARPLDALREVEQRAAQAFKIAQEGGLSLLTHALDQLTLGRVALYRAILARSSFEPARELLTAAVDGLRASGNQDLLPLGLLSRAWAANHGGDPASGKADLDEAWQIAERGGMKLHMADIVLHRARLFRDRAALEAAARLIEETGYHRRDEELADARAALETPAG